MRLHGPLVHEVSLLLSSFLLFLNFREKIFEMV